MLPWIFSKSYPGNCSGFSIDPAKKPPRKQNFTRTLPTVYLCFCPGIFHSPAQNSLNIQPRNVLDTCARLLKLPAQQTPSCPGFSKYSTQEFSRKHSSIFPELWTALSQILTKKSHNSVQGCLRVLPEFFPGSLKILPINLSECYPRFCQNYTQDSF